jgi:hypothetical protein
MPRGSPVSTAGFDTVILAGAGYPHGRSGYASTGSGQ